MSFKVLSLFVDLFVDFITVYWWVTVLGQHQDKVNFQFRLDVVPLAPIGVLGFVINDQLHRFGKFDQFVFGISEVVFDCQALEDVVEGLLFKVDAQVCKWSLLDTKIANQLNDFIGYVVIDFANVFSVLVTFVIPVNYSLKLL